MMFAVLSPAFLKVKGYAQPRWCAIGDLVDINGPAGVALGPIDADAAASHRAVVACDRQRLLQFRRNLARTAPALRSQIMHTLAQET